MGVFVVGYCIRADHFLAASLMLRRSRQFCCDCEIIPGDSNTLLMEHCGKMRDP